jgi:hypothetical protein
VEHATRTILLPLKLGMEVSRCREARLHSTPSRRVPGSVVARRSDRLSIEMHVACGSCANVQHSGLAEIHIEHLWLYSVPTLDFVQSGIGSNLGVLSLQLNFTACPACVSVAPASCGRAYSKPAKSHVANSGRPVKLQCTRTER